MSTIADLQVKIGADGSGLSKQLNKSKQEINQTFNTNPVDVFANSVDGVTSKLSGMVGGFTKIAAIAAGGFGLSSMIDKAVQAGDAVYQLTSKYQMSTGEAVQMNRILSLTGGSVDTAARAIMRMDKSFTGNSAESKKAQVTLAAYGVSLTDASGKMLPINQQLANMAAGYREAQKDGEGQAFIMNTLGIRGMELTKTLQNYNEAAATASKIQGIGLNPQEMHKASQDMKQMQMQLGQLEIAAGAALAPMATELLPEIVPYLRDSASWISKNKTEISETVIEVAKLVAAYEAWKIAKSGIRAVQTVSGVVGSIGDAWKATAPKTVDTGSLTKSQEQQINRSVRASEKAYDKMRQDAIKTAQQQNMSAEESAAFLSQKFTEIGIRSTEEANTIRTSMTEAFAQINVAAGESAALVSTSVEKMAAPAVSANAEKIASNETVIASNAVVSESETATGLAAAESAGVKRAADAEKIGSNEAVITSNTAVGNAAYVTGEKTATANVVAQSGVTKTQIEVKKLGMQHEVTGAKAKIGGTMMSNAVTRLPTMIGNVTNALFAMAGGWVGIAIAAAMATNAAYQYFHAKEQEVENATYVLDGVTYVNKGEDFYRQETNTTPSPNKSVVEDPTGSSVSAAADSPETVEVDGDTKAALNQMKYDRYVNSAEYQKDKADADIKKAQDDLDRLQAGFAANGLDENGNAIKGSKDTYGSKELRQTAEGYAEANLGNLSIGDCTILVKTIWGSAGIDTSGLSDELYDGAETHDRSVTGRGSWITTAKARGAWHDTDENGAGYTAQQGDAWITNDGNHIILDDGHGGYYAAGSSSGAQPQHFNTDPRSAFAGNIMGVISLSQMAGMDDSSTSKPKVDWGSNQYWQAVKSAADEFSENPYVALAMAAVESGGGDINAVNMAAGGGMFQIQDGKQDAITSGGQRGSVDELFPGWDTDMGQNARAAMGVLRRKQDLTGTAAVWDNVKAYNGGGDPDYLAKVQKTFYGITDDKGAEARTNRLLQAQQKLAKLTQEIKGNLAADTATTYDQDISKIAQDYKSKVSELKEVRTAGADTTQAQNLLDQYKGAEIEKITQAWRERWSKLKVDLAKTNSEIYGDYRDLANAEYDAAILAIDKEREARLKEVEQSKGDIQAAVAVNEWATAQYLAAAKKRDDAMRDSYNQQLQWAVNNNDANAVVDLVQNDPRRQETATWEVQKKALQEYVTLAKQSDLSLLSVTETAAESIAGGLDNIFSGLGTNITSVSKLVQSFGNLVISTLMKIVAQAAASRLTSSIFGSNLTSGSTGSIFSGLNTSWAGSNSFSQENILDNAGITLPTFAFADGGVITAPTLSLIGEGKDAEGVFPLNNSTYSNLANHISQNMKTGKGVAPVININNNSDAQVSVESVQTNEDTGEQIYNFTVENILSNKNGDLTRLKQAMGAMR